MRLQGIQREFKKPWRIYWNYIRLAFANKLPPSDAKNWVVKQVGVNLGDDVFISPDVTLDPIFPEYIHIGDDVFLGWNTRIFAHMVTPYTNKTFRKLKSMEGDRIKHLDVIVTNKGYRFIIAAGEVWIGDGAFVGAYTTVRPGVRIGDNAIIGSDSLVLEDIPEGGIAYGFPAKIRGDRNE